MIQGSLKELLLLVAGQLGLIVFGMIGLRFLTEVLPQDEFGRLSFGMSIAMGVALIAMEPFSKTWEKEIAQSQEVCEPRTFTNAKAFFLAIVFLSSIGVVLIVLIGIPNWYGKDNLSIGVFVGLIFGVARGLTTFSLAVANAQRMRLQYSMIQWCDTAGRYSIGLLCAYLISADAVAVLLGYIVYTLMQSVYLERRLIQKDYSCSGAERIETAVSSNGWKLSSSDGARIADNIKNLSIIGIFNYIYLISDKWSLAYLIDFEALAQIGIMMQIGYFPMSMFCALVIRFINPIIYQYYDDSESGRRRASSAMLVGYSVAIIMTLLVVSALWAFGEYILRVLVSEQYAINESFLPLYALAGGAYALANLTTTKSLVMNSTSIITGIRVAVYSTGAVGNVTFIYLYGLQGAAWFCCFFSIIYFVSVELYFRFHKSRSPRIENRLK